MLLLLPEPPVTAFMSVCLARDCNEWYYCLPLLLAAVCLMFRLRIFACCCLLVGNDERHGCTSYDRRTYVPSTKQKNTSTILFFAMFVLSFDQHELFNRKNENILLLFFFFVDDILQTLEFLQFVIIQTRILYLISIFLPSALYIFVVLNTVFFFPCFFFSWFSCRCFGVWV